MDKKKNKNKPNTKRWNDDHPTKIRIRVVRHEEFTVNVSLQMRVLELRKLLELTTGIPYNIQRLTYLDAAELVDNTTLEDNEVVPGGTIDLLVWSMWYNLVDKAIMGQIAEILELGVSFNIPYSSPITEYMDMHTKIDWMENRAFVVLCIGVHRENMNLCEEMLPFVKSLNTRTPLGRTPLHIAASQGKTNMLKFLLDKGFKLHAKDKYQKKAIDLASLFCHAEAERFLFMSAWEELREKISSHQKKRETAKSTKKEETISQEDVSSENKVTDPAEVSATSTEEKPGTSKNLSVRTTQIHTSIPCKEAAEKEETQDFDLGKAVAKEESIKPIKDVYPHIRPGQDPDSLRQYLVELKKQCKNFGYTASMIDDHLQWLDNVKCHSFHPNPLMSEDNG